MFFAMIGIIFFVLGVLFATNVGGAAEHAFRALAQTNPTVGTATPKTLRLVGGFWKVWFLAAGWINTSFFQGRTSLNEKTLRSRYLEITQRRNKIAHDADLIDGDLKQRRPIDEAGVNDAIDWIERIALAIAHVLDDEG